MNQKKNKLLVIALVVAFIALCSFGTLAFYSVIGTATNTVTTSHVELQIHEVTADGQPFPAEGVSVIPGDVVDKIVSVENVCSQAFYLRVKLVNGSTDLTLSAEDCLKIDLNTEYWTAQADGYIYYNTAVEPGQTTEPVFTQVEVVGDQVGVEHIGQTMSVAVKAYAVQSKTNPAEHPWDASGWPAE